jgi:HK97 family phage major capsid protein
MQERAGEHEGKLLGEDETEYEKREADLISLNKRIEVEQRTQNAVSHNPEQFVAFPADGSAPSLKEYRSGSEALRPPAGTMAGKNAAANDPEVRKAIYSWLHHGQQGMDQSEYRVLSKAASGGGYFVPIDLADQVVRALRFLPGGIASLARTIVTGNGDIFNIPLNLTHGVAAWIAESGTYTPSDETMTQGVLSAYKAGTKIIVSEELLTDSAFDLSSFITQEFGERIGLLAETAFITGVGTTQPTGILNGAVVTRTTLVAGQVATTTYAGLAPAFLSVPYQYRYGPNSAILVSDSLLVRMMTIVDSTGRPIWNASMAAGTPDTVLGMPVYAHPTLAAIAANSESGIVGDFSRAYWIRRVDGVFMQRQNELHSDSGQVGFRAYLRLDGNVVLPDALRVIKFAAT